MRLSTFVFLVSASSGPGLAPAAIVEIPAPLEAAPAVVPPPRLGAPLGAGLTEWGVKGVMTGVDQSVFLPVGTPMSDLPSTDSFQIDGFGAVGIAPVVP